MSSRAEYLSAIWEKLLKRRSLAKPKNPKIKTLCWEWYGCRNSDGYGKLRFAVRHGAKQQTNYIHRIAAAIKLGLNINNASIFVRHRCDNPPCFNPAHLLLGTQADNNGDTLEHGRHRCRALSDKDVMRLIWSVRSGRQTIAKWAAHHKVAYSTARKAFSGETHNGIVAATHSKCDARFGTEGSPFLPVEASEAAEDEALEYCPANDGIPF